MVARRLRAENCRTLVAPDALPFRTTAELEPSSGHEAQERALTALAFGLDIRQPRFHVVAVGPSGTGRTFSARNVARKIAANRPTPDDVLLLPNPSRPSEPKVLFVPAGEGRPFVDAMGEVYTALVDTLRGATEGERYKQARSRVQRRANAEEARLEEALRNEAGELGFDMVRNGDDVELTPKAQSSETPDPEVLRTLARLVEEFESTLAKVQDEAETELRLQVKQILAEGVRGAFAPVGERYAGRAELGAFLADVEGVVQRELKLLVDEPGDEPAALARGVVIPTLLTDHLPGSGAPVIEIGYPTSSALFGRSHAPPDSFPPEPGFAIAGALHQANGGFLILPAAALLKNEALYEQLKACLLAGKFLVPEGDAAYVRGTAAELLFPTIPIDVKVVLVASPDLYQQLHEADPEFSQLFKVQARFEAHQPTPQALKTMPPFLAGVMLDRGLPPLTSDGVAELLFYAGRLAESQTRVTAQLGRIAETAIEAGYRAQQAGRALVDGAEVRAALGAARRRGSHFRDEVHALIADGIIRIEVTGSKVGQVNAISVLSEGPVTFGRPCRVTAVVYAGASGPINIAREVEMSGPIHSKGVLILTGFLASRFGQHRPVLFGASLVFEQTYEAVDGDSASSSELYALLSALSGFPLRQDLAVTGSVDQQGSVQPVGGINEKIESFFDLCVAKGLTGQQGVIIPESNCDALMLRPDVVEAIGEGRFHVHAVRTVEEGIELLTGVSAGTQDEHGRWSPGSVFGAAETRLGRFHDAVSGGRG